MTGDVESLERLQRAIASRLVGARQFDSDRLDGSLDALDPDELSRSSRTLRRKRLSQTAALLPMTRSLLGASFDALFFQYANQSHFNGPKAAFQDGAAFAKWLCSRLDARQVPTATCAEQVVECCRFEGGVCAWQAKNWFFSQERFDWDWTCTPPVGGPFAAADVPRRTIRRWLWRLGPWTGGRVRA